MSMFGRSFQHHSEVDRVVGTQGAGKAGVEASLDVEYIMSTGANISTWVFTNPGMRKASIPKAERKNSACKTQTSMSSSSFRSSWVPGAVSPVDGSAQQHVRPALGSHHQLRRRRGQPVYCIHDAHQHRVHEGRRQGNVFALCFWSVRSKWCKLAKNRSLSTLHPEILEETVRFFMALCTFSAARIFSVDCCCFF